MSLSWTEKKKRLLDYFLASEGAKRYITTETGLKIRIGGSEWRSQDIVAGTWEEKEITI